MRTLILVALASTMTTLLPAQTLPVPQAITDPKLITSKPDAQVEQNQQSLSIERLYMTRSVGASAAHPFCKNRDRLQPPRGEAMTVVRCRARQPVYDPFLPARGPSGRSVSRAAHGIRSSCPSARRACPCPAACQSLRAPCQIRRTLRPQCACEDWIVPASAADSPHITYSAVFVRRVR